MLHLKGQAAALGLALLLSPALAAADDGTAPLYATPQDALEALVAALRSAETDRVIDVIDPSAGDLVRSDDSDEQRDTMAELLDRYEAGYRFVPTGADRVVIDLGADDWPFPVPLVRAEGGWRFDAAAGREEVAAREVGRNELDVIDALSEYVELQAAYRRVDHDGDGVMEFASVILSSEGAHDGLYWDGPDSPVGDLVARASLDGFDEDDETRAAEPYLGYYFRILDAQGPGAAGGELSYLVNGNMVAGHALLAVPAEYDETGVHSFIVGENGIVYEADLGPDTLEIGDAIELFDPGADWTPVEAGRD